MFLQPFSPILTQQGLQIHKYIGKFLALYLFGFNGSDHPPFRVEFIGYYFEKRQVMELSRALNFYKILPLACC